MYNLLTNIYFTVFAKFKTNGNTTINFTSGKSRSIPCQASGFPRPDVSWIKNERPLSNKDTQNSTNVEEYNRISNLIFENVSF